MRTRLPFLAALAILALAMWPAVATAGGGSMGNGWSSSGARYLDPSTGIYIPIVGPVLTFTLTSDSGYRGDYALDGASFVEVPLGTTPLRLDVPLMSVHTVQTRLLYPSGDVDLTGPPSSFAVDNVGPRTTALNPIRVREDGRVRFRLRLTDQGTPTDTVTIKVKTLKGRLIEALYNGSLNCSAIAQSMRLKVSIPTGKYRWFVYASDGCGNKQTLVGRNTLKVTR